MVDFTLDITNAALFDTLVDDFINELTLEIVIDVNVEFLGALSTLPDKLVSKTIEMNGFAGVSLNLMNFQVTSAIGEMLEFNFWIDVYNPTPVEVNLTSVTGDIITMNHTKIGYFHFTDFKVESGSNYINVIVSISGAKSEIGDILRTYISGIDQTLLLNYSLICGALNGLVIEETYYEFNFNGCDIDLVEIDIEMITLSVSALPSISVSYDVDTIITLHNPVDFSIEIIAFNGTLQFDDNDNSSFPLIGSYTAQDNIFLTDVDFDWTGSPIVLGALAEATDTFSFSDNNIEKGVRLYDEYINDNDLHVDIVLGHLYLKIGDYDLVVPIIIENIYVPND